VNAKKIGFTCIKAGIDTGAINGTEGYTNSANPFMKYKINRTFYFPGICVNVGFRPSRISSILL
jgi:hypothetical protein